MYKIPATPFISFDIFDTLIKRSVAEPTDLFRLMEGIMMPDGKPIPQHFAQKRIKAEKDAFSIYDKPVTIEQIYEQLKKEYGGVVRQWMKTEIQIELRNCVPYLPCAEFLRKCVSAGKRVILISDMYLSSLIIDQMLKKCGIFGYEKIFVSCEWGAKKKDGSLFGTVLNELEISPRLLTHIGDNRKSDFIMPLKQGINALFPIKNNRRELCKIPKHIENRHALTYRTLQAIKSNCSCKFNETERHGCSVFGPLLAGYVRWLAAKLEEKHIDTVCFLARDGFMLMKAFEELQIQGIRSLYLYASRRSYIVPMLWIHPEFEEIKFLLDRGAYKRMTLKKFLERIGLEAEVYAPRAEQCGIELEQEYISEVFWEDPDIRLFYEEIREDVIANSRKEYVALSAYIEQYNFPARIAVADVGYAGTIQYCLQELIKAMGKHIQIYGFYIEVAPDSRPVMYGGIQTIGYLRDQTGNHTQFDFHYRDSGLYEAQFLKPQGSVKCFALQNGVGQPLFSPFEYEASVEQKTDEFSFIDQYQSGALMFVRCLNAAFSQETFQIEPDVAAYEWFRLSMKPTLRETVLWGDIRVSDIDLRYMARPKSLLYYCLHPYQLRNDFAFGNRWKIGFIKRMLKVPLPYVTLYDFLRKQFHRSSLS